MITHPQQIVQSSSPPTVPYSFSSYDTAASGESTKRATPDAYTIIRHAEPDDISALHDLLTHPTIVYWTSELPCAATDSIYQRLMQPSSGQHTLIATRDNSIAGMLGLSTNSHPRVRHGAKIGPVAVHPDYQGQGIGTALVKAAVDLADQWFNIHRLELMVYTDNEAAIALYKKFGFVAEGVLRHYAFRAGEYADIQMMARFSHS